jgi:hypothetical protein
VRGLAIAIVIVAANAHAEDSRDPSEGAPQTTLRPIAVENGVANGDGVSVTVDHDRRAARVIARFVVEGAPGPHVIDLETPTSGVIARWEGALLPLERTEGACAPTVGESIGIDPKTGASYPIAAAPTPPCETKRAVVTVGESGRGTLELEHDLSAGYDRLRRRRTMPEVAHLFAKRTDYFVYHFAARGPTGAVTLSLPPRTDGTWKMDGGLLRISATEKKHVPLGATLLVGTALDPAGLKLAVRGTVDALLPWGDAIAIGADGDTSLRVSTSLTYQFFGRWLAFLPIGGNLETGAVLDVNPRVRVGARFGLGGYFLWISTHALLDLYDGWDWRISWVTGIGF